MKAEEKKPRVFISHSSQDKHFVKNFSWELLRFGFDVWYDDWEIAIGDSIVDKVFAGLDASDTLIVVLSPVSVESSWVKEELSTAVMRRISENDIRILPVLIESCELPTALRHIRYADFRYNRDEAMSHLLDSLAPGHLMWQSLEHHYDHLASQRFGRKKRASPWRMENRVDHNLFSFGACGVNSVVVVKIEYFSLDAQFPMD